MLAVSIGSSRRFSQDEKQSCRKGRPMMTLGSVGDLLQLEAMEDARDSELLRLAGVASQRVAPLHQVIAEYEREQGLPSVTIS